MASIDLGKLKFNWRGQFQLNTAYETDDVVYVDASVTPGGDNATYVATQDIDNTNTALPQEAGSGFDRMTRGLSFEGAWDAATEYYRGNIVTNDDAAWVATADAFTGGEPGTQGANWLLLVPAPDQNVLAQVGDMVIRNNQNNTVRLPIGANNATLRVAESPIQSFTNNFTYSVSSGNAVLTDDNDANNVFGDANNNATIDLTRGQKYVITFPADGINYSVKDPNAAGYTTAGSGGRLVDECNPDFVSNGGSITFVATETTPNTVVIRNEANGTDVATVTIHDMVHVPSWGAAPAGGSTNAGYKLWNCNFNNRTNDLLANDHAGGTYYGRGLTQPAVHTHRQGGYIDGTNTMRGFGDCYQNGTQGYTYYSNAIGYPLNYQHNHPPAYKSAIMYPEFLYAAFAGDEDYADWLLDVDGNDGGWESPTDIPVREIHRTRTNAFLLLENGLVFVSGYNGYGISGGGTQYSFWNFVNQSYHDANGTKLQDTTFPRIKQIQLSTCGDCGPGYNDAHFGALDTNGNLYVGGHNNYGQLGRAGTTTQTHMQALPQSLFNNEEVIYFHMNGNSYSSTHVITETGRLYSWGYNGGGLLGVGSYNNYTTPQYAQGVSGTSIAGKTVIHVIQQGSESSVGGTYVLCSDGTVHSAGYADYHGANLGYPMTNTAWQSVYRQVGSTSDIYADNQRVVSIWAKGSRYAGLFMITDGGDNGRPTVWSMGSNNQGQNGTNQGTSDNTSTSSLGHFGLYECQVQLPSDYHKNTATVHAFSSDTVHNTLNIGAPVAVFCNGYHGHESMTCVMITSTGMGLWCGKHDGHYLTSNRGPSYEYNQMTHNGDYAIAFTVVPHMPKCKEVIHSSYGESNENGTIWLAENGDIHLFGGHGWGCNMTQFGPTTVVLN